MDINIDVGNWIEVYEDDKILKLETSDDNGNGIILTIDKNKMFRTKWAKVFKDDIVKLTHSAKTKSEESKC